MTLKEYCFENEKINDEKIERFIVKVEEALREKGISQGQELKWYKCFLRSALYFIFITCPPDDWTFEGLLKICSSTQNDVYEKVLDADSNWVWWQNNKSRFVNEYKEAKKEGMPQVSPTAILREIFIEWGLPKFESFYWSMKKNCINDSTGLDVVLPFAISDNVFLVYFEPNNMEYKVIKTSVEEIHIKKDKILCKCLDSKICFDMSLFNHRAFRTEKIAVAVKDNFNETKYWEQGFEETEHKKMFVD